eukprot:GSA25T00020946001.1
MKSNYLYHGPKSQQSGLKKVRPKFRRLLQICATVKYRSKAKRIIKRTANGQLVI